MEYSPVHLLHNYFRVLDWCGGTKNWRKKREQEEKRHCKGGHFCCCGESWRQRWLGVEWGYKGDKAERDGVIS